MKEVLIAMAEYNRDANAKLAGILKAADSALLREDQGSYYKSVLGTLEHVVGGQINWLKKFDGFFGYRSLKAHRLIAEDLDEIKGSFKDKPEALLEVMAESDALMVDFVRETEPGQYAERVGYTNYKGEKLERTYWNLIFHILNHATHHRGEISALLARTGIANDFAGFTAYRK